MAKIVAIAARSILNSKGNPTIETTVTLDDNNAGIASVPSGTSVGTYEAVELLDNDEKNYKGKGVLKAIENIKTIIAPALSGKDPSNQTDIDSTMLKLDGTENKSRLGANTLLSVSIAVAKSAAKSHQAPLFLYLHQLFSPKTFVSRIPSPMFNLINGGKHATNNLDFQEFLVIPASSKPFSESLKAGDTIFMTLKELLTETASSTLVGDEGGFGPTTLDNSQAIGLLQQTTEKCRYSPGIDIFFGIDAAADSFYANQKYTIKKKDSSFLTADLLAYYEELFKTNRLLYLEDPFAEDDFDGFVKILQKYGDNMLIVGDDLVATNPKRLQMAIEKKAMNAVVIKPNQIGTISEAMQVVKLAKQAQLKIVVAHRSGETNDDFIADFAVAVEADYVKFGAPNRGERVAKYNRLLAIEKELQSN